MELEQKYTFLYRSRASPKLPTWITSVSVFRPCRSPPPSDRDCATLLAPWGLSEGRFVLLFLL